MKKHSWRNENLKGRIIEHFEEGMQRSAIARKLDCSRTYVHRVLQRAGLIQPSGEDGLKRAANCLERYLDDNKDDEIIAKALGLVKYKRELINK